MLIESHLYYILHSLHHLSFNLAFFSCIGSGIPKVVNLEVSGELVEGNTIKGLAEVAWCGGTPGKGVARYDCLITFILAYASVCALPTPINGK